MKTLAELKNTNGMYETKKITIKVPFKENKNIDKKYFSYNGDGTWSANMCPASLSYKLENYVISIEEI